MNASNPSGRRYVASQFQPVMPRSGVIASDASRKRIAQLPLRRITSSTATGLVANEPRDQPCAMLTSGSSAAAYSVGLASRARSTGRASQNCRNGFTASAAPLTPVHAGRQ